MNYRDKILELKEMLDDPRTGLKDSSNTNKTRYGILALFETSITQALAEERERMRGEIEKLDNYKMTKPWSGIVETFIVKSDLLSSLDNLTDNKKDDE